MPDEQLQPYRPDQPEPGSQPLALGNPQAMIQLAIERGAGVDVMERLLALHDRMKAAAAKEAFDVAMADFQASCPAIVKSRAGAKNAYLYAPLDEIVHKVKPLLRECGFSYQIDSEVEKDWVKAKVKVTHSAGHSQTSEFKVPIDTQNPMMTAPQRYGGAMTFAKRYCFCNAFGILTADVDLDGANPQQKPTSLTGGQKPRGQASAPAPQRPKAPEPSPTPTPSPSQTAGVNDDPEAKALRGEIWTATKKRFADGPELQQWLWDEGALLDTEELQKVGVVRLKQILAAVRERIR